MPVVESDAESDVTSTSETEKKSGLYKKAIKWQKKHTIGMLMAEDGYKLTS